MNKRYSLYFIGMLLLNLVMFTTSFYLNTKSYQYTNSTIHPIPQEVIFAQYRLSLFMVNPATGEIVLAPLGTAVAISERHLLTAAHVVTAYPVKKMVVEQFDCYGTVINRFEATISRVDVKKDLALLVAKTVIPIYTKLEDSLPFYKLTVGDWMFSIGALHGSIPFDVRWGQLVTITNETYPELAQCSNIVGPGDSGGGVYNSKTHRLIGIISRGDKALLFVPLPEIKEFLLDFSE